MEKLLKSILESALLPKALEYGGYDKIPVKEVEDIAMVAVAATAIIKVYLLVGGKG